MCHQEPSVRPTEPRYARRLANTDAAPLSFAQLRELLRSVARELLWGLPGVAREVQRWRTLAQQIPVDELREDALSTLANKRGHIDGAALFTILPRRRNLDLLRLLVAYEVIWDFLDTVNEHGATAGQANGRQLHVALIDALDPTRPISDYYRHHPWKDDGGYLRSLVETCRAATAKLPSYPRVRARLLEEATRAQVLAINHDLDPQARDDDLRQWALEQNAASHDLRWFELSGAASASMAVHALLALATEPAVTSTQVTRIHGAYFPWISAATTMLDSYVDQAEDVENGDHSYIAHYATAATAARRTRELTRRSFVEAGQLPRAERHILIVACMLALYLSKDSVHVPSMRTRTNELIETGGTLTRLVRPILRLWRIIYSQRAA